MELYEHCDCGDGDCILAERRRNRALAALVPELVAEIRRLHSWDGLMSILDQHYRESVFPTLPDDPDRDPGPRIISLIRNLDAAQAEVKKWQFMFEHGGDHMCDECWPEDDDE